MKHDPDFVRQAIVAAYGHEPASVLAKRYGKSRNAIIGIWHRWVPADVREAVRGEMQRRKCDGVVKGRAKRRAGHRAPKAGAAAKKADPIPVAVERHQVPHTAGIPIVLIKQHQCRYPVGGSGMHLFCGERIDPTCRHPFCAGHRALVYAPPPQSQPDRTKRMSAFQFRRAVR